MAKFKLKLPQDKVSSHAANHTNAVDYDGDGSVPTYPEWREANNELVSAAQAAKNLTYDIVSNGFGVEGSLAFLNAIVQHNLNKAQEYNDLKHEVDLAWQLYNMEVEWMRLRTDHPTVYYQLLEQEVWGGPEQGSEKSVRWSPDKPPYDPSMSSTAWFSQLYDPNAGPDARFEWLNANTYPGYYEKYIATLPPVGTLSGQLEEINAYKERRKYFTDLGYTDPPCKSIPCDSLGDEGYIPPGYPNGPITTDPWVGDMGTGKRCYDKDYNTIRCPEEWPHTGAFDKVCYDDYGQWYKCGDALPLPPPLPKPILVTPPKPPPTGAKLPPPPLEVIMEETEAEKNGDNEQPPPVCLLPEVS